MAFVELKLATGQNQAAGSAYVNPKHVQSIQDNGLAGGRQSLVELVTGSKLIVMGSPVELAKRLDAVPDVAPAKVEKPKEPK